MISLFGWVRGWGFWSELVETTTLYAGSGYWWWWKLMDSSLVFYFTNFSEIQTEHCLKMTFKINKYTFADVVICVATGTISVEKRPVVGNNALASVVARFTVIPVTIRGRIAVQPGVGIVRRWLVKSYPASTDIAITHIITDVYCRSALFPLESWINSIKALNQLIYWPELPNEVVFCAVANANKVSILWSTISTSCRLIGIDSRRVVASR